MPATEWLAACGGAGLAAATAWLVAPSAPPPGDDRRRAALRARSPLYREMEGTVDRLAAAYRRLFPRTLERTDHALRVLGEEPWRAAEYLAVRHLKFMAVALFAGFALGSLFAETAGAALAVFLIGYAPLALAKDVVKRAEERVTAVRDRLPYALDLMALVLEGGSDTLHGCLRLAARENAAHPLGEELGRVVAAVECGAATADALALLVDRLGDPDIHEVAVAMAAAEASGVPLKDGLRAVAERLRTRQAQWAEKASERAKVSIVWPTMAIMCACLAIIATPAVLGAVTE